MRIWILSFLVLCVFVINTSCEGWSDDSQIQSQEPATVSGLDEEIAHDFNITLYEGGEFLDGASQVSISMLKGKRLVLNFWAPLCGPCRAEMPELEAFWKNARSNNWLVLGVDLGRLTGLGDMNDATEFLEEIETTYPTGYTNTNEILDRYGIFGMPTTIFIDEEGRIVRSWVGAINRDKLEELSTNIME